MNKEETICAIATGRGGALGIIRVSGPNAIINTDKIFIPADKTHKLLSERKAYTISYGHITNKDGEIIDEVLVSLFRAPHSYTGENCTEISCHGSEYILKQIMQMLIDNGCRAANPGEFTQRAFLNGKMEDDVKEVTKGFECGLQIENYNDIQVGDIIEVYVMEEVKRTKKSKAKQIEQEHNNANL